MRKLIALVLTLTAITTGTGLSVSDMASNISDVFNSTEYTTEQKETAAEETANNLSNTLDRLYNGENPFGNNNCNNY